MKLVLEQNAKALAEPIIAGGRVLMTPPLDEDFWLFRVKVGKGQAVVAFPKFTTLGIGFAKEENWNTNLPYTCDTEEIYAHIACNKGDGRIPKARCIEAIAMLQEAVKAARAPTQEGT